MAYADRAVQQNNAVEEESAGPAVLQSRPPEYTVRSGGLDRPLSSRIARCKAVRIEVDRGSGLADSP